jgi:hypothetical protein
MPKGQKKIELEDEPGAEERFLRGVQRAVNTPPKPFTPPQKAPTPQKRPNSKKA